MNTQKGLAPIVWVVIAAIVLGGGYVLVSEKLKVEPARTTETIVQSGGSVKEEVSGEMKDWKTYRNEKYGFEFRYPKEWSLEKGPSTPESIIISTGDVQNNFSVFVGPITDAKGTKLTLEEYLVYYNYAQNYLRQDKNTGAFQMLRFESRPGLQGKSVRYILVREDLKYEFVLNYMNVDTVTSLEKVVSTFRFTR